RPAIAGRFDQDGTQPDRLQVGQGDFLPDAVAPALFDVVDHRGLLALDTGRLAPDADVDEAVLAVTPFQVFRVAVVFDTGESVVRKDIPLPRWVRSTPGSNRLVAVGGVAKQHCGLPRGQLGSGMTFRTT